MPRYPPPPPPVLFYLLKSGQTTNVRMCDFSEQKITQCRYSTFFEVCVHYAIKCKVCLYWFGNVMDAFREFAIFVIKSL